MTSNLITGTIPSTIKVVPYTRLTRKSKWTDKAKRYLKSRKAVTDQVKIALLDSPFAPRLTKRPPNEAIIHQPFRLVLVVYIPKVKSPSSANYGTLPDGGDAPDLDNLYKGFNDGLVDGCVVPNDSPRWYRGHTVMMDGKEGVYIGPKFKLVWGILPL